MKAARTLQGLQQPQSLIGYVRQFLTPTVWNCTFRDFMHSTF
jgi:hypothetical protein